MLAPGAEFSARRLHGGSGLHACRVLPASALNAFPSSQAQNTSSKGRQAGLRWWAGLIQWKALSRSYVGWVPFAQGNLPPEPWYPTTSFACQTVTLPGSSKRETSEALPVLRVRAVVPAPRPRGPCWTGFPTGPPTPPAALGFLLSPFRRKTGMMTREVT